MDQHDANQAKPSPRAIMELDMHKVCVYTFLHEDLQSVTHKRSCLAKEKEGGD